MKVVKILIRFFLIIGSFSPHWAFAEYRAFLLQIKTPGVEQATSFKSSLDPEQYRYYYNVGPGVKISYAETWMCPPRGIPESQYRRTIAYDPICKSPKELAAEKAAAAAAEGIPTQSPERQPSSK